MDKEKQVRVAKKAAGKTYKYQQVFNSPEGQEVLKDLMNAHHVLSSTFDGDIRKTIFREGERNVVLRILSILKMDVQQMQERIKSYEATAE